VGLTFIVVKKHPGRAVQLGYDNPLNAIDHKGAVVRHERYLAHVDFLLFNVFNGFI
jgi:hypothetical protein